MEAPRVDCEKLAGKRNIEDSKTSRVRVQAARERQLDRFAGTKLTCNALQQRRNVERTIASE